MTSCSSNGFSGDTIARPISAIEARSYLARAGVEFVDPRRAEAVAATTGKIPFARMISTDNVEAGNLPPAFADRSIHVVVTCQRGVVAASVAETFARLGFARVSWVEGGTEAWLNAGFETIR